MHHCPLCKVARACHVCGKLSVNKTTTIMNHRFYDHRLTALEEQAYVNAKVYFAESLKRLTAYGETVERLQRNLSFLALAADIAASSSPSNNQVIQTDEGTQWRKDVDLMENIHLCHRTVGGEVEFAVVEHFPAQHTNEIWNQGHQAIEVLRVFAGEQRQALQVWTEDMEAQVKEFLAGEYPGQDMSRVEDGFIQRFTHAILQQHIQTPKPSHTHGVRVQASV